MKLVVAAVVVAELFSGRGMNGQHCGKLRGLAYFDTFLAKVSEAW